MRWRAVYYDERAVLPRVLSLTQCQVIVTVIEPSLSSPLSREATAGLAPQFVNRWSSRAFSDAPVSEQELQLLFEAARWAPSSGNGQPWLFIYADQEPDLTRFRALLKDGNQRWAGRAPVLAFAFAAKLRDGQPISSALLDLGAAWMSLALQAHVLGLNTRAMGGVHRDRIYEELGVPEGEYQFGCAIAIGRPGQTEELPEDLRERNRPNERKPTSQFVLKGGFRRG